MLAQMPANFAENIWNLASTHAPALKLWQAWVVVSRARKKKKSATRSLAKQKKARRQEQRREGNVERMKHSNKLQALSFLTECPHAQLITPLVVQLKGTTAHSCQSLFDSLVDQAIRTRRSTRTSRYFLQGVAHMDSRTCGETQSL